MDILRDILDNETALSDVGLMFREDRLKDYSHRKFDDALACLFDVKFSAVPNNILMLPGIAITDLKFRIKSFTIPEDQTNTDDIKIRGITVSKPIGDYTGSSELSFSIIIDRDFSYYKIFKSWKDLNGSASKATRSLDYNRGEIIISSAEKIYGNPVISWKFRNVSLVGLGSIEFDSSSGEPLELELTFKFAGYEVV